jgi:hypothetical protein
MNPESITTAGNFWKIVVASISIHYQDRWLWIPGSRFARPGMTVVEGWAALVTQQD